MRERVEGKGCSERRETLSWEEDHSERFCLREYGVRIAKVREGSRPKKSNLLGPGELRGRAQAEESQQPAIHE